MASKKMTTVLALYFTFNLVFLGFASAKPATPPQHPVCPLTRSELNVCVNILSLVTVILNPRNVAECCNLLTRVGGAEAAKCACDAAKISVLGLLTVRVRLNQLLSLCPAVQVPLGGLICN
ncbi:hypothetical protein EUTSA_v10026972mg [Eutrema salsugineum]|uniref:Hydrophobic seed protein domain-containing protein n=1 Tax=Eutrema salsugineum TaxID=72664 RepID=V4LWZ5_EUTSA|nr:putative lipid-binding protein AIR1 [Eutrema salsugineum]XP_006413732.1 putative lipid-binding protein AIR1 [Eutrema salsugineum]ESQ55108.1 hypothetical protein EUTSA_v10026586mg [Eutrema salsugineum]ESQ55185.1 hypothetical protein EUTSA_v10026972mg [Eutrema salsugineum]